MLCLSGVCSSGIMFEWGLFQWGYVGVGFVPVGFVPVGLCRSGVCSSGAIKATLMTNFKLPVLTLMPAATSNNKCKHFTLTVTATLGIRLSYLNPLSGSHCN